MRRVNIILKTNGWRIKAILILILITLIQKIQAQGPEDPPRPIVISTVQSLAFGTFYHDPSGGWITVNPDNTRISSPGVICFPGLFSPAAFDITGNPGTVITITFGPDINLAGSSGGSMSLHIESSLPVSPIILTNPYPIATPMTIGGTLTVGVPLDNPPGNYSGTFEIIFNQN